MKKLKTLLLAVMIAITSVAMCVNISAETDTTTTTTTTTATPEKLTATVNEDYYLLQLTTTPGLFGDLSINPVPRYDFNFTAYRKFLGSAITDNFFVTRGYKSNSSTNYIFKLKVLVNLIDEGYREKAFNVYQGLVDEFLAAHGVPDTFEVLDDYPDTVEGGYYIEFTCKNDELFRGMWIITDSLISWTSSYPSYETFSKDALKKVEGLTATKEDRVILESFYDIQLKDHIDTDTEAKYICEQAKAVPGILNAEYVHVQTSKDVEYTPLQMEIMRKSPMAVSFMPDSWYLDRVMPRYDWNPKIYVNFEDGYGIGAFYKEYYGIELDSWGHAGVQYYFYHRTGVKFAVDEYLFFDTFEEAYNALSTFADVNVRGDYWGIDNAFKIIEGNKSHIAQAFFNDFDDLGCYVDEDVIKKYLTPEEIAENLDEINAYLTSKNLKEMTVPSIIGNANDNLIGRQVELIREAHEIPDNEFMPDKWFVEKTDYNFSDCLLVYFVDGYELNPNDFRERNITEIKRAPEFDEEYGEGAYFVTFERPHDATFESKYFSSNHPDKVKRVVDFTSFPDKEYKPTAEDIKKYGTIGLSAEEVAELWAKFGITPSENLSTTLSGDLDNNGKIQLNDVVILSQAISAENIDDVLDSQGKANADVFADGIIDSADLSVFSSAMVNSQLSALPIIPNNE
jgi:hypothetical protein